MRQSFAVIAAAAAGSVALLAGQAGASSTGSLAPAVLLPSGSQHALAVCAVVPVGAGIGNTGGFTYHVIGAAANPDPNTLASQVECKLYDTDTGTVMATFSSGYKTGPVAVIDEDYTVHTLDNFVVCVRVDSIDNFGNVTSTPWTGANGSACGS